MRIYEVDINDKLSCTFHQYDGTNWVIKRVMKSPWCDNNNMNKQKYQGDDHILWVGEHNVELHKADDVIVKHEYSDPTCNICEYFRVESQVASMELDTNYYRVACGPVGKKPTYLSCPISPRDYLCMMDDRAYASGFKDCFINTDIPISIISTEGDVYMGMHDRNFYFHDRVDTDIVWQRDVRTPHPHKICLGMHLDYSYPTITQHGMILTIPDTGGNPILVDLRTPSECYALPELHADGFLFAIND